MWKLIGILALVAIGGAALIGGGAWYWWTHHGTQFIDSGKTAMLEGEARGRVLNEGACMVEAIERHRSDWNRTITSAIQNNLWLTGCLNTSRVQEKFCDDVPFSADVVTASVWVASVCAKHGLSDSYCGNLISNAAKYCSSPQREEKLRPGASPPATRS